MKKLYTLLMVALLAGCSAAVPMKDRIGVDFNDPNNSLALNLMRMSHIKHLKLKDFDTQKALEKDSKLDETAAFASVGALSNMSSVASMASGAAIFGAATLLLPVGGGPEQNAHFYMWIPEDKLAGVDEDQLVETLFDTHVNALVESVKDNIKVAEKKMFNSSNSEVVKVYKEGGLSFFVNVTGLPAYRETAAVLNCSGNCTFQIPYSRYNYIGPYEFNQIPKEISNRLEKGTKYYLSRIDGIEFNHPMFLAKDSQVFLTDEMFLYYPYHELKDAERSIKVPAVLTNSDVYLFIKPKVTALN